MSGPADCKGSALVLEVKYEEWELAGGWMSGAVAQGPCLIIYDYTGLVFRLDPGPFEQRSGISRRANREQSQRVPAVSNTTSLL